MSQVEIKVPNIGDFDAVEVIEVLVAEGDTVKEEQSLITVESDKASMEIPSSAAGKVVSLSVKVGDKVAEGDVILMLEAAAAGAQAAAVDKPATQDKAQSAAKSAAAATAQSASDSERKVPERAGNSSDTRQAQADTSDRRAASGGDSSQVKYSPPASAPADGCD